MPKIKTWKYQEEIEIFQKYYENNKNNFKPNFPGFRFILNQVMNLAKLRRKLEEKAEGMLSFLIEKNIPEEDTFGVIWRIIPILKNLNISMKYLKILRKNI